MTQHEMMLRLHETFARCEPLARADGGLFATVRRADGETRYLNLRPNTTEHELAAVTREAMK